MCARVCKSVGVCACARVCIYVRVQFHLPAHLDVNARTYVLTPHPSTYPPTPSTHLQPASRTRSSTWPTCKEMPRTRRACAWPYKACTSTWPSAPVCLPPSKIRLATLAVMPWSSNGYLTWRKVSTTDEKNIGLFNSPNFSEVIEIAMILVLINALKTKR